MLSDRDAGMAAAAAAAAAAGGTGPTSAQISAQISARRNLVLPDSSRHSSPTGSDPNSVPNGAGPDDPWGLDGKATSRPRHRLDLNSVSLAMRPDGQGGLQNSMPLPAPALSAPSSTEGRPSYVSPASMPTIQYECADTDKPPPGCAADAIKLFVGSIPKSCTESQLLPFFETIGKVVDLVVVRDRVTRESKGSAFLWYATRAHAEQAILQFNLRHVLQDPSGEQNRPLVLRRAKSRAKPVITTAPPTGEYGAQGYNPHDPSGLAGYEAYLQHQHQQQRQGQAFQGMNMMHHGGGGARLPPNYYPQGTPRSNEGSGYGGDGGMGHGQGGFQGGGMGSEPMGQVLHGSGAGSLGLDSVMMALRGMGMGPGHGHGGGQQQQQPEASEVSMSLALSWPQLSIIKDYIHGVQSISGAKLTITAADSPGVFCLSAVGMTTQVQAARDLLLTVLHRS